MMHADIAEATMLPSTRPAGTLSEDRGLSHNGRSSTQSYAWPQTRVETHRRPLGNRRTVG